MPKYLLVISGPTASGKTGLSVQLAKQFSTVILSADSRQFYRQLNIGTAKPDPKELEGIRHYFINSLNITDEYSVGDFERDALALLDDLFQKHDLVLLVGGSGLFIQALCEGLDTFPEVPPHIRAELDRQYRTDGLKVLLEALEKADPDYYRQVDLNNPQRVIRALEVYRASGLPYSHFRRQAATPRSFQPVYIQLQWPRAELYQRINLRVDQMMAAGLLQEVQNLLPFEYLNSLQTVGYQELFGFLNEKYSLEEAIELIKRNSRRYAKRQLTWNRRSGHWKHFFPAEINTILTYLQWVMTTGKQLLWKTTATPHADPSFDQQLGMQSGHDWQPILEIHAAKKQVWVKALATETKDGLSAEEQKFLLHEVIRKYVDLSIFAVLPKTWDIVLQQLGFTQNNGTPSGKWVNQEGYWKYGETNSS